MLVSPASSLCRQWLQKRPQAYKSLPGLHLINSPKCHVVSKKGLAKTRLWQLQGVAPP